MSTPAQLFDRKALSRQRQRAEDGGFVGFVHEEALFEIQEKLMDINRPFTAPAVVTGFPDFWRRAFPQARIVPDDALLDLDAQGHDLVVLAMTLHWANDPVGQLVQARRALKPDGVMMCACLGGQSLHELRASLAEAEAALKGGLSPRIAPMGEIRDLGALLQRAGLALPVADSSLRRVSYPSAFHLIEDLRGMGETNALAARPKTFTARNLFGEMARIYQNAFPDGEDRITATFELIFLTGWAPDDSQQTPLRPGSAKTRLADFLQTDELGADAKPVRGDEEQKK